MRLGVHVSIGKGLKKAIDQALERGCDCFQIFVGNPRSWNRKLIPENEFREFKTVREARNLWPMVVHLAYLPNLASSDPDLYQKSLLTLREDFTRANKLGADFFVFHPGKSADRNLGMNLVTETVNMVLEEIQGPTMLLFENQAGGGNEIAGSFNDLGVMLNRIHLRERVGVCWDTCHAFVAGYDLRSPSAWEKTLNEFDQQVGLSWLKMFHLNDAVGLLGSHFDRHQHIGEGTIGLEGFRYLINHPDLSNLPGILETPQNTEDDDLQNLAILRGLIKQ